ncbi:Unconventional myosin-Id [Geodia barretti]|uniref:Unconventional myosin-Id n=1 Tax=Geodia barretti TaxID=519541 RepID=A0AA35R3E5_GEOBA|nr:Unconventional myosin-Id [Geodia barretti]
MNVSMQHFLTAMDEKFKGHDHYSSRQVDLQAKDLERDRDFVVRHYAGDVVYVTFPRFHILIPQSSVLPFPDFPLTLCKLFSINCSCSHVYFSCSHVLKLWFPFFYISKCRFPFSHVSKRRFPYPLLPFLLQIHCDRLH